jgi:hypothetical protein
MPDLAASLVDVLDSAGTMNPARRVSLLTRATAEVDRPRFGVQLPELGIGERFVDAEQVAERGTPVAGAVVGGGNRVLGELDATLRVPEGVTDDLAGLEPDAGRRGAIGGGVPSRTQRTRWAQAAG